VAQGVGLWTLGAPEGARVCIAPSRHIHSTKARDSMRLRLYPSGTTCVSSVAGQVLKRSLKLSSSVSHISKTVSQELRPRLWLDPPGENLPFQCESERKRERKIEREGGRERKREREREREREKEREREREKEREREEERAKTERQTERGRES